ncbi:MAG TPA: acyltransferase [Kofleriaceae bacterium]
MAPKHRNNFDALRLLAATAVIVHHTTTIRALPFNFGFIGVAIFFIISGYLIMQSWDRNPDVLRFIRARVLRIFPGLFVAIAFTILVIGPLLTTLPIGRYFSDGDALRYLYTLDLMHLDQHLPGVVFNYGYPVSVNTPLWTLPVELKMYLFLAILGAAGALRTRIFVVGAFVIGLIGAYRPAGTVFTVLGYWGISTFVMGLLGQTNNYPLFFLAGSLLYMFRDVLRPNRWVALALFALWIAGNYTKHLEAFSLACMPYFIITAGLAATRGLRDVIRIGDLSYGLYIYAFPIQHVWMKWSGLNARGHGLLALLVFSTTAPIALASWHLVEKRALRFKGR